MPPEKLLYPVEGKSPFPWLWIGTWSMGGEGFGPHDLRESLQILKRAIAEGITHFDTAGLYAHGRSEELLSKAIKGLRQRVFLSTKGGLRWEGRRVRHDGSPQGLREQLLSSLRRLKTEYVDLYLLHWPDPEVPIRESIDALKALQKEGLTRFWGVCNLSARRVIECLNRERDIPHQVHFNPIHRDYGTLRAGETHCINCIISPLEQGLLCRGQRSLTRRDIRRRNPYFRNPEVLRWVDRLHQLCEKHSFSPIRAVLLWICSTEGVNAIIPGPRRLEQLEELLSLLRFVIDQRVLTGEGENSILKREARDLIPGEVLHHLDLPTSFSHTPDTPQTPCNRPS